MFEIALTYIKCVEDTNGPGNDEPYVIVFAADLANTGLIPLPANRATLYGPFQNMANSWVEEGSVVARPVTPTLCWGFDGNCRTINNPNDPLILIGLMESDHGDDPPKFALSVRGNLESLMFGDLTGLIPQVNAGTLTVAGLQAQAIAQMEAHLELLRKDVPEFDEVLGPVQLLPITSQDLMNAQTSVVEKVLTFRSEEEDSEYELTFKIGVGPGSVGSGLSSSGPTDRYAAIWTKGQGSEWTARHRMTEEEYQKEFTKWTGQGYRLTRIDGYNYAGTVRFAAIWEKSAGPAWIAKHNLTSAQYQKEFDKQLKDGYRLTQISGYAGHSQDLYAAIWTKAAGPEVAARHRMTSAKYQSEFNKLLQQGFHIVDVSCYEIGNQPYYAAIWEKKAQPARVACHGLSPIAYQKEFQKLTKDGYRPVHVSPANIAGKQWIAAIFEKTAGPEWVARHNMTSDQYQEEFKKLTKQGYRPFSVAAC